MKTLEDKIKIIDETPLTIKNLFTFKYPIKTSHILYSEIKKYNYIENIFKNNKAIIILIDKPSGIGHFVCIFKKDNIIHFFDPYGFRLSKVLNIMNINDNSLLDLINKSKYDIKYNNIQYESEKNKVESCGLHCVSRLMLYSYTDDEYNKFLKYKDLRPCEIVGLLCFFNII